MMESLGGPDRALPEGTIGEQESHWDIHYSTNGKCANGNNDGSIGNWTKPVPTQPRAGLFNESYAIFGMNHDLEEDSTTFYVNGTTVGFYQGLSKLVDKPHSWYHILNYAVGGPWGGFPTSDTVFPTTMECDFVRHYSPSNGIEWN